MNVPTKASESEEQPKDGTVKAVGAIAQMTMAEYLAMQGPKGAGGEQQGGLSGGPDPTGPAVPITPGQGGGISANEHQLAEAEEAAKLAAQAEKGQLALVPWMG